MNRRGFIGVVIGSILGWMGFSRSSPAKMPVQHGYTIYSRVSLVQIGVPNSNHRIYTREAMLQLVEHAKGKQIPLRIGNGDFNEQMRAPIVGSGENFRLEQFNGSEYLRCDITMERPNTPKPYFPDVFPQGDIRTYMQATGNMDLEELNFFTDEDMGRRGPI